jgi:exopolyphosphatase
MTTPASPSIGTGVALTRTITARTSARPLASFFSLAKQTLLGARVNKVPSTLVLGKDDPDLDSIASAVIFAYFRSALPPKDCWSPIYIPLLNERRAELKKNMMLQRVLYHSAVSIDGLVTVDDVVSEGTQSGLLEEMTKFFFVDHNVSRPAMTVPD